MIDKLLRILHLKDKKFPKTFNYLIIAGLVGLLLILLSNLFSPDENDPQNQSLIPEIDEQNDDEMIEASSNSEEEISMVKDMESKFEKDLQAMLENIQGVSDVDIMVNLDSTNIQVYEKDLILGQQLTDESDRNGGERKVEDNTEDTQVVLVRQGEQEVPLLVQTKKPDVRGVFVVAKGVDHETVKMWVTESVSKVLDVPTHRVSVMPKN